MYNACSVAAQWQAPSSNHSGTHKSKLPSDMTMGDTSRAKTVVWACTATFTWLPQIQSTELHKTIQNERLKQN